jgi:hypothetical protein
MFRRSRAGARGVVLPALAGALICCSLFGGMARAQGDGPFFEPLSLLRTGYELRVSLRYHVVTREDFATPVFLFPQPVARIAAHELRAMFDLRLAITPALAVQVVVPVALRLVDARLFGLLVSADELLPDRDLDLDSFGLGDPTLALSYRFIQGPVFAAFAEGGSRLAIDDNPGALTLPTRVPLGSGQNALFAGVGANLRRGALQASLAYRFEYRPSNAAAYLVRRVSPQGYTSGSLSSRIGQAVRAELAYAWSPVWSVRLTPEWSVIEFPELVTNQGDVAFSRISWLHDLALGLELRLRVHARHVLALVYRQPLLSSSDDDPLFPIEIPAQGVGVAWHASGF